MAPERPSTGQRLSPNDDPRKLRPKSTNLATAGGLVLGVLIVVIALAIFG